MRLFLLLLSLLVAGCAATWSPIAIERVGPVEAEIWRNNKTNKCERRVFLDAYYFKTEVDCDAYSQRTTEEICRDSVCVRREVTAFPPHY